MKTFKKLTIVMATLAALALVAGTAYAADIPILNSGFELGNQDFTSEYQYFSVPGSPANSYGSGYPAPGYPKASLYDEGTYGVGVSPAAYHGSWADFGARSGSKMMIVNGATSGSAGSNVEVWAESVSGLEEGKTYFFSAYVTSVYPKPVGAAAIAPALLAFSVNGNPIGPDISAAVTGRWDLFYQSFVADETGTANISLINRTTMPEGNDFAIDDIGLSTKIPTVPEPATMLLLGLGLVGLAGTRRKFKK